MFRPSLPPESSTTTRMRSGLVSMLVPSSAWAARAAEVRLSSIGSVAPTPRPYMPLTRNSRREHPHLNRAIVVSPTPHVAAAPRVSSYSGSGQLILRRAQNQIQQRAQRRLGLRRIRLDANRSPSASRRKSTISARSAPLSSTRRKRRTR